MQRAEIHTPQNGTYVTAGVCDVEPRQRVHEIRVMDGWESTGGSGNGEIYFEGITLRNGYSAWRARTVHHEAVLFSCVPIRKQHGS